MNTLEKYKVIEALGPHLNNAQWRELLYNLENCCGERVITQLVKFCAKTKPDALKSSWPLDKEDLEQVLLNKYNGRVMCQDEVDELLRGLNS